MAKKTWRNPHVYFEIAVTGERGSSGDDLGLGGGSVAGMVQSGWSERTLDVGDAISVEVAPTEIPAVATPR